MKGMKRILTLEEYSNMIAMLEDYFDALKAKELEEESEKGGISLDQLIKKYCRIKSKNL